MGMFGFMNASDVNAGIAEWKAAEGSKALLDVRAPEEYAGGHIPGSANLPLQQIVRVEQLIPDKNTALFVYCLSGARSARAAAFLQKIGYTNVKNIGGIANYSGELERN